jgi:ethanolaminephosphotransferase
VVYGPGWVCFGAEYHSIVSLPLLHSSASPNRGTRSLNVIKVRRARGDKSRGALLGLIPFFVTWTLIPAYLYLNPEILNNHLVPFVFFAGLVNAYSVGQIITAHLVKLDFPYYNVLVLPIAYGVFDSLGPFLQRNIGLGWPSALGDGGYQVAYVFCMLGMAIGVYGSFVVSL